MALRPIMVLGRDASLNLATQSKCPSKAGGALKGKNLRIHGSLRLFSLGACLAVLLAVACGGSSSAPAQETPGASPTAAAVATRAPAPSPPASQAPVAPNGERILADVRQLADTIGPRPAGSAKEKEAADFIADRL